MAKTTAKREKSRVFRTLVVSAVVLAGVALAAPSAEASRSLPSPFTAALEPELQLPGLEHAGSVDAAGEAFALFTTDDLSLLAALALLDTTEVDRLSAENRYRLFAEPGALPRPVELAVARKLASGVSTCGLGINIWQTGGLSQNCGSPSFQGLWTDPTTGLSYARNRWYDARTASWLSEDPKGAVDSPNLYAFVGWGPHVGTDPLGESTFGIGLGLDANVASAAAGELAAQKQAEALRDAREFFDRVVPQLAEIPEYQYGQRYGVFLDILKDDSYSANWTHEEVSKFASRVFGKNDIDSMVTAMGEASWYSSLIDWQAKWFAAFPAEMFAGGELMGVLSRASSSFKSFAILDDAIQNRMAAQARAANASRVSVNTPYQVPLKPGVIGRPNPDWSIDTLTLKNPKARNAAGYPQDNIKFWRAWLEKRPETLSEANRQLVSGINPKTGMRQPPVSPKIDDVWLEYFPHHAQFKWKRLVHHHVGQGRFAIPVPQPTHPGPGGVWHGFP